MNWPSVERLFAAALETPAAERQALLDSDPDDVVRAEVRRLLARHDALCSGHDSFLGTLDLHQAATLVDAVEPEDPAAVGRYEIVRRLGSGATGVVYLARDPSLARHVALKLLSPHLSGDAMGIRRFTDEARAASRLDNPHIVGIHEIGRSEDDRLFIAMAYHEGETLRDRIARGPLPVAEAVRIAGDIADGLSAAHAKEIVHRDIKPENILLTARGACIVDFGIAKVAGETLTRTGAALGTAAYMSPEQTRGTGVDHRSDLWSLGVVLYEMLTGVRPFRGESGEALVYQVRHDTQAPISRFDIPPAVALLVGRCLEKDPALRYESADDLLSALGARGALVLAPASRGRRHLLWRWLGARPGRRALALTGALGLIVGALWAYRGLRPEPARFEPNLLAVAPFDVSDSSLRLWREGLVDVLSLDLDGAGPLRTVPQTIVVKRWTGRADRASAAQLGSRTRAELVVFGHLVRRGADSVSVRATVLDRSRNATIADLEVLGEERRMGALADSLGVKILRTLGRSRPIGSVRHVSIGSRSLPALKEFLRAEHFYRLGRWDSAIARYERALAEDSTFALALRRMYWVVGWGSANWPGHSGTAEFLRRAVRLNHGLSPRDSALLRADSFRLANGTARDAEELVAQLYGEVGILEDLARRYPDDPGIWYELGERRRHQGPPLGGLPGRALEAFDRAIALDSGFAPAYEHTVSLALQLGREDRAREYARAYAALNPTDANAPTLRLVALVFDSGVHAPAVRREVQSATVGTLLGAVNEYLSWWADSAETAIVLLRELVSGRHELAGAPSFMADSLVWRQHLASALAFRGHLRAAAETTRPLLTDAAASALSVSALDPFHDLVLLGVVEDSIGRLTYAHALRADVSWDTRGLFEPPRFVGGLRWWLSRGDTASIARFARRATEVARATSSPKAVLRARYFGAAATAYLALARGDSAGAERLFQAIPDTLCLVGKCFFEKLTLARLLAARGEDRRAAETLDRWGTVGEFTTLSVVIAALERARVAERMGELERARERYEFVVDAWRNADPELQPYVAEARAALARVAAHRN